MNDIKGVNIEENLSVSGLVITKIKKYIPHNVINSNYISLINNLIIKGSIQAINE